eukprot:1162632-Pyramimonas_sp.AAC.1
MARVRVIDRRTYALGEGRRNLSDLNWREPRACRAIWHPSKRCSICRLPESTICVNFPLNDVSWIS